MGIESAAVSAGVIENPKRNIPLATLMGLGLAAVVYVLSSTVIMGIIPNAELQKSHAPFAEAARIAVGTPGMVIIAVCAVLKSFGSLGGWMLLVGQSAKAAADDGMFPERVRAAQPPRRPGRGLVIVGVLMTDRPVRDHVTHDRRPVQPDHRPRRDPRRHSLHLRLGGGGEGDLTITSCRDATFQTFKWIAIAAVVYCLWTVLGGDPTTVVNAMVALLISVPLYPFFIRSMEEAAGARPEPTQPRDPMIASWLAGYRREWLRLDVVAGLTAAAVVIPKAMAYATIAGLPVQVGLYTALVPTVIYALLGTSRVLSVSTTTTIAILVGTELARVAPTAIRQRCSESPPRWRCWSGPFSWPPRSSGSDSSPTSSPSRC